MPKRRLTDAQIERACELRERGLGLATIGAEVGCSPGALSWHFLKLAVDPPKPRPLIPDFHLKHPVVRRGNHLVRAFTPEEDARLIEMELQGMGLSAIGRELGRKPNSLRGRLMTLARREERGVA